MKLAKTLLAEVWNYLREVSGENDYARYCEHARKAGIEPMTLRAFYLHELDRKHSRITRCC